MTAVVFSAALLLAALLAAGLVGERRRRAEFGRLSKRQLIKYR